MLASGSVGAGQLASGAAAANLNASGQSGVPSGGMILSPNSDDGTLLNAGYVRIGRVQSVDTSWSQKSTGSPPAMRYLHTAVWTGNEMIVWGGNNNGSDLN